MLFDIVFICFFRQTFLRAKKGSKKVESVDDIKGYLSLKKEDKQTIDNLLQEFLNGAVSFSPCSSISFSPSPLCTYLLNR